jgi:hypothetical protein
MTTRLRWDETDVAHPAGNRDESRTCRVAPLMNDEPATNRSAAWMVAVAATSVLASIVLFALGAGLAGHFAGYALASLVPFTLIATFRRRSVERLVKAGKAETGGARALAIATLACGLIASIVHAYLIARHYE